MICELDEFESRPDLIEQFHRAVDGGRWSNEKRLAMFRTLILMQDVDVPDYTPLFGLEAAHYHFASRYNWTLDYVRQLAPKDMYSLLLGELPNPMKIPDLTDEETRFFEGLKAAVKKKKQHQ